MKTSIDLGTNTCLLLVAEFDSKRRQVTRTIADFSTVVRLGQGVDQNKRLHPEAKERTLQCLRRYSDEVRKRGLNPEDTVAVATSQARDSADGAEFFKQVEAETGFRFRTLSGDEEAQYTFMGGLLPGMSPDSCAVIDIGGGSTELTDLSGGKSLDIGSVRFTERFFATTTGAGGNPVSDREFWACQEAIDGQLASLNDWRRGLRAQVSLVGVAGTVTTLAAAHLELPKFDAAQIDGLELSRGDVHRLLEELKWRSVEERCQMPGVERGRADVLLAGALILWRAMELLDFPVCRVSTRGLRYGVLSALS